MGPVEEQRPIRAAFRRTATTALSCVAVVGTVVTMAALSPGSPSSAAPIDAIVTAPSAPIPTTSVAALALPVHDSAPVAAAAPASSSTSAAPSQRVATTTAPARAAAPATPAPRPPAAPAPTARPAVAPSRTTAPTTVTVPADPRVEANVTTTSVQEAQRAVNHGLVALLVGTAAPVPTLNGDIDAGYGWWSYLPMGSLFRSGGHTYRVVHRVWLPVHGGRVARSAFGGDLDLHTCTATGSTVTWGELVA